jgi:hypothetical protein
MGCRIRKIIYFFDMASYDRSHGYNFVIRIGGLKRIPEKQECLRLFSFLALDSFALMAWCIYENPEDYDNYSDFARKYSKLVLDYYKDIT